MQVERFFSFFYFGINYFLNSGKRVSNALVTCLEVEDSLSKDEVIFNGLYSHMRYIVKLRRFERGLRSISLLVG
jgi:hypothetical protein